MRGGAELGMIVSLGIKLVISGGSLGMGREVTQGGRGEAVAWGTKGTHSWGTRATHSWVTEATHEWGGRGEDLCLPGRGVEGVGKKSEVLTPGKGSAPRSEGR